MPIDGWLVANVVLVIGAAIAMGVAFGGPAVLYLFASTYLAVGPHPTGAHILQEHINYDGSYVTGKPRPGDFDACWDPTGVVLAKLDPVFLEFANGRAAQKAAFKGEFFPSSMMCVDVGQAFVDFFQMDRFTGKQKGIISIPLSADPLLSGKVQS